MTGQQVREWMARWGVTQEEMAKRLGISQPRVSQILKQASVGKTLCKRVERVMLDVKAETARRARALMSEEVA